MSLLNWIKQNKLASILLAVVLLWVFKNLLVFFFGIRMFNMVIPSSGGYNTKFSENASDSIAMQAPSGGVATRLSVPPIDRYEAAPAPEQSQRMVIQSSNLSLLVKDVSKAVQEIREVTESAGGYMVESNVTRPEEGGNGTITVRVPEGKLNENLRAFKSMAVKVVSENLKGRDVTDQYVDNQTRLEILERNKARFEEIMENAVEIDEIMRVQREIFSLQSQIDSLKGQQNYLEKNAQMVKVSIFLSTDEVSLPYAPTNAWRPEVIFKQAVRSVVRFAQGLGSFAIWVGVYAVIWVPILLLIILVRKIRARKKMA